MDPISKGIAEMSKTASWGGFILAALLVAGASYWVVRERSQSTVATQNVAEAPAPAVQKPAENSPPTEERSPSASSSPSRQAPASPGESPGSEASRTTSATAGQSGEPTAG